MANVNDEKIMELKAQIKEKKAKLKGKKKFTPITNCSIEIDGARYNLQVLSKEQLINLLVKLNTYRLSAIDLDLLDEYVVSAYKIDEWITDIKSKLEVVSLREEESKLQELERKLHVLLSNDKKVELEIEAIMSQL
jgi:hypothetical protein